MIGGFLAVNIFRKNAVEWDRRNTAAALLRVRGLALVREKMFQTTEKIGAESAFSPTSPTRSRMRLSRSSAKNPWVRSSASSAGYPERRINA